MIVGKIILANRYFLKNIFTFVVGEKHYNNIYKHSYANCQKSGTH
jgi:hypothetical protein